ncbi:MAG: M48 family metalloprotease [Candidatus Pacebacteria bacterium]|nr:M48 family metalloprotease [Candidatus Paceibacterota bacterium]PIR63305.1 MAG: zinc metalloprotease HtpX [Candidatus Pacebacteria bacterium CG10_big_fil_rev_8_21_14_0_10_40_26]PIZ79186.1 MAG: zinc metalloprotease HtpX [Candidatus Pacebacteria bacterium CG_4_10_14_0_2_um_filter_40_20]PJA68841.1 MAG: zinc metalloprotease HtpX [Candidatus Pacebacteria bacterium CG_4_9_14_3_um_filter_40_12]PJC42152.1 MAG: zinc metalloprotease HtpX [Candidatus Pacebacteria bacterium CG_4_9_14_0_2_um_filter_40_15
MNTQAIIRENTQRTYLYMFLLILILGTIGHGLSSFFEVGLTGTSTFIITSLLINVVAFFFSDKIILRTVGAKKLDKTVAPDFVELVANLANNQNLPQPKLYYMDTDAMNAFATGRDQKHSAVVITRGLLEKMKQNEVEAVVAHELAHIKYLDVRLMTIVTVLAGLLTLLSDMFWYSNVAQKASERDNSGSVQMIGMALALFAPFTALLIQNAISRKREYIADAAASDMIGSSHPLIEALEKIRRDQIPLPGSQAATAHLFFSQPSKDGFIEKLFSTHPPLEERIEQLKKLA